MKQHFNMRCPLRVLFFLFGFILTTAIGAETVRAQSWDLLIRGGHVIDPKNGINGPMDVAIFDGRIAKVGRNLPPDEARRVVDARGYYVTPGLIDVHAHIFFGSTSRAFADGSSSVWPDHMSFRAGITTMVDPGNAGWRNFEMFKENVIDQSATRVLAFINIVGHGLRGDTYNNDFNDMDVERTLQMVRKYPDLIVGTKIGHVREGYKVAFDRAMEVSRRSDRPLLLECNLPELEVEEVLGMLRPGDIFTHAYEPGRRSLLDGSNRIYDYVWKAEERGILFDVGHGGASFRFSQAIPSVEQGFWPYTFGTDLHRNSMNGGMKDMLNVMSKFLNMGMELEEVIRAATWNSALSVKREDLGHLSEGAEADVAILSLRHGNYGFVDSRGFRLDGDRKLMAELTIRAGRVVWDLNGLAAPRWDEE